MKGNYRDQGRLTFLAPLHQTPSCLIAFLFAAHMCDSKVSLLAGYCYHGNTTHPQLLNGVDRAARLKVG